MGDFREGVRTQGARLRAVPRVYAGLGVIYVLLRILAVTGTSALGAFPDTATYRHTAGLPAYPMVSLTGHAMRPWVAPLLFAVLPNDNARSIAQVLLSIGAWLVLAATVALALRDRRVRMTAFVVILAFSCTTAVTSWDRIIGSESTAISFAVLAFAAWIRFARGATPLNGVAVVVATTLWSFTKSGMAPVVALAALIVLVSLVVGREQRLRAIVAVVLLLIAGWGLVANARTDTTYEAFHGDGLSQFNINFQLELRLAILNHPGDTAWFVAHGMPDPRGLDAVDPSSPVDASWVRGEDAALAAYVNRSDFVAWGNGPGRRVYAEYVATHPGRVGADFARAVPYLLVPPQYALIYAPDPRNVMPAVARNLFFATSDGPHLPRAMLGDVGLLLAACLVLLVVSRRRARDSRLLAVAGAALLLSIVALAIGWVLSPIEIVRHALPATLVLRLALWITLFALVDALVSGERVSGAGVTA